MKRSAKPMRAVLFGARADSIRKLLETQSSLELVETDPQIVVCYGGDGTLLSAELKWPGVPKVPIRNSRRGNRCIDHPPEAVLERLAKGRLIRTEYIKLECETAARNGLPRRAVAAMNEVNVHMGRINAAVRFQVWINDEPFSGGNEIIGDGFVVSTPFGSTAYFNQITRGVFYAGLGIAFKNTTELTSHAVVPEDSVIRVLITRGPALLAYDNAPEYLELASGDSLRVRKHRQSAVLMTWEKMKHPSDAF
jgi:NAD+ kinase